MPTTAHNTLPIWQGVAFLAAGLVILLASPKIVAWNISAVKKKNRWFLKWAGYVSDNQFSLRGDSPLNKWTKFSYWFVTLLFAAMLLTMGAAILLRLPLGA